VILLARLQRTCRPGVELLEGRISLSGLIAHPVVGNPVMVHPDSIVILGNPPRPPGINPATTPPYWTPPYVPYYASPPSSYQILPI
jgi:hypothetical protein